MIITMREFIDKAEGKHDVFVFYHFDKADVTAETIVRLILNEEKPSADLGQGRRILFHKAHVPNTQAHIHFQVKGANIAAVNKDGSAHDRSHGIQLQKWAIDGMTNHYPNFNSPKKGIIEKLIVKTNATGSQILNESGGAFVLISKAVMLQAVAIATKS